MVIRSGSIRAILCVAAGAPLHACTPDQVPSAQVFDLPLIDLSHATSLADSTSCEYFSCDHAADYIGTNGDLQGDGAIYPKYAPFNANAEHTTALVEDADHSGAYYCEDPDAGCDLEVVDPVLKPIEMPVFAEGEHTTGLAADHSGGYYCEDPDAGCSTTAPDVVPKPIEPMVFAEGDAGQTSMLANSTECEYFSCDHSADYAGTYGTPENGTGDGVIFPKYAPFNANAEHTTGLADAKPYSEECEYYSCDHSADYIGTDGSGTGDGVIYPKYFPFSANGEHTTGLAADHSGGYYCEDPDAGCSTTAPDVVPKPIEPMVFAEGDAGQTSMLANSTECEYFSCDHAADYIGSGGDQLGDGTIYPAQELAPVAPAAAPAPGKGSQEKPCRPTPGHLLLMGHACVFGALEATGKLVTSGDFDAFVEDFKKSSISGAKAVTPVGGYVLGNALKA
jgi:hypothetical protein